MEHRCRACGELARTLEASGVGGAGLHLPFTPEFEVALDEEFSFDGSEPRWLCRFLDARACACGAADLAAHDPVTYLECDGPNLPLSPLSCPACAGPLGVECYGVPGRPSAYLAARFGAPLAGRVWLSLYPDDTEQLGPVVADARAEYVRLLFRPYVASELQVRELAGCASDAEPGAAPDRGAYGIFGTVPRPVSFMFSGGTFAWGTRDRSE